MSAKDAYGEVRNSFSRLVSLWPWTSNKSLLPDDAITRKIQSNEIPTPDDVMRLVGKDNIVLKSVYFTLAVLYDAERREGARPYFVHPYSVAVKPDYRYADDLIPSGFRTTSFMKCLGLIHDLREVFGKTPEGSHVVGVNVGYLLGNELAEGLGYLTNNNDTVIGTIKDSVERLRKTDPERYKRLDASDISERLSGELERLNIDERSVIKQYRRIQKALVDFVNDIRTYHPELSDIDRAFIVGLIQDSFLIPISKVIKRKDIISPSKLESIIREDFEHVIGIVDGKSYVNADQRLILPKESPFLVTLDKTLYQDFLNRAMDYAFNRVIEQHSKGQLVDDSALSVPIVRVCDTAATLATFEDDIAHAISQYRKARRVSESGRGLIERLEQEGVEQIYERFRLAIDYSNRILGFVIGMQHKSFQLKAKIDNVYDRDVELLEYMLSKMSGNGNEDKQQKRRGITSFLSL